jgi:hypothetical protein
MEIPGIPQNITREQLLQAFQVLGIDAGECYQLEIQARAHALYVEVYADWGAAQDAPPNRFWDGWRHADGKDIAAAHRIAIPIVDDGPKPGA